jgi:CubicO group peptidase (beta-lactamase class C family)
MQRMLFIFFITLSTSTCAQQLSKQDEQFVDSVMNANYPSDKPGAVLLIAKKGEPVYRKAYGLANLELNVPNRPEYVFSIASMSKQFTAVCVLKLAQEGKLNLQDDIKKYLPQYNTHGRHITIENLLTHTSGINVNKGKLMLYQSPEEMLNFFMNDSLLFEPGTDWAYSNTGYLVAGLIVEKVSGLSLGEYLQQNIFDPLGLSHTYVGTQDSVIANAVNGYQYLGNNIYKLPYFSWTWYYGAGGIVSNVDDLLKWDNALYTEKVIKKEWFEKAWKPFVLRNGQTTNYGFGWTSNNFHGIRFIEHSGGLDGFNSEGIRIPSERLYIVILSNNGSVFPDHLARFIALRVIGQTLIEQSTTYIDTKTLTEYTGVYAIPVPDSSASQKFQYITVKNDSLFSQSPGDFNYNLIYVSKDLFVSQYKHEYHHFQRNEKNEVVSVELYNEPIQLGPRHLNTKTTLSLPKEKQAVIIDVKKLVLLKGKYDFGGGQIVFVTVENNKLYLTRPTEGKDEIFAENDTTFFSKTIDWTWKFIKENDKVSGMIVIAGGSRYESKKIE